MMDCYANDGNDDEYCICGDDGVDVYDYGVDRVDIYSAATASTAADNHDVNISI